jgi:hypothetical protein
VIASILLILALAAVHPLAERVRFSQEKGRARWLSLGGGIAAGFVFLELLPTLHRHQQGMAGDAPLLGDAVYLTALSGLVVFLGLERAALSRRARSEEDRVEHTIFWGHMAAFAFYNALFAHLLVVEEAPILRRLLLALALAAHFVVNDFSLREHHRDAYHRVGRWLLTIAIIMGGLTGLWLSLPDLLLALLLAFLSGAILLNVFKEEIPAEGSGHFGFFAAGVGAYGALMLLVRLGTGA